MPRQPYTELKIKTYLIRSLQKERVSKGYYYYGYVEAKTERGAIKAAQQKFILTNSKRFEALECKPKNEKYKLNQELKEWLNAGNQGYWLVNGLSYYERIC